MKISIWDTAGQETYRAVTRSYFRSSSAALIVFDITRRKTFENATSWLRDLRQIAEEDIVVVLVGNKSDLSAKRQVTGEEAEAWCKDNKVMKYVETSAKSGENVERAFLELSERIYQNIEAGKYDLADKRSGVKVAGAGGGNKTVTLSDNGANGSKKGAAGGCC
jgi:GTPase SAR1 family protein